MPYAGPVENEWAKISLTFNNNSDNNNNNKRQTNFSINHNNVNENTSTSTVTTTTFTTFSTTASTTASTTTTNSKTLPLSSSLQDYNKNNTISSNIEDTPKHRFSSSLQPEFLATSLRRKSAPELLKPLVIPQKKFQHEDDQFIIIRKKSGEIVKPSLKKRSKSEPNTPILPKYVHFNADLEQIRLFREAQEPQAVSADVTSDESDDDDDDDFVFSDGDDDDGYYKNFIDQEPELTITIPNMPPITTLRSSKPVFVNSIFLSRDKNKLQGHIMVQNIAFRKLVEVRYTFDFWQTVSEVKAIYAKDAADKDKDSFDIFIFTIELFDNSRNPIDGKTMYFAVHYNVSNRDYWDNNSGSNYQVDFEKVKKSSSSSQCNHHCHQSSKANSNHNQGSSLPKLSSTAIATNSSSSSRWPIIPSPVNNLQKSLSNDCHSPPNSTTHTSIADSRKKGVAGRYDIGVSLSAAQNIPRSSSSSNSNSNANNTNNNNTNTGNKNINKINNNNSSTTTLSSSPISSLSFASTRTNYYYQSPYIPAFAISCDAYKSFSSGNYIDGMPVTTEAPQWEGSPKRSFGGFPLMSSNPIAIPTTKSTNSYYDHIVSQYCFSSGSPYATAAVASSPYASSPPVI